MRSPFPFLGPSFPLDKVTLVAGPEHAGGFWRMVRLPSISSQPVSSGRGGGPLQLPAQGKADSWTLGSQVGGRAGACATACLFVIARAVFLVPGARSTPSQ